jgi:Fe-S oxidoreductase
MRAGNEYLFQALAQANIEIMNGYGVKKIITICPHGYNCIKKDYPNFGGNFEVYHHTEILSQLIGQHRIKLTQSVPGTFVYHDSCFLGRYNQIYTEPRRILRSIPGLNVVEWSAIWTRASAAAPAARECGWKKTSENASTTPARNRRLPRARTGSPWAVRSA